MAIIWLEKNGAYINYLPLTVRGSFKIKIFRDTDNLLKVLIGNSYAKEVTLICRKTDIFQPDQKIHSLYITWKRNNFNFYINGKLVDTINGKN